MARASAASAYRMAAWALCGIHTAPRQAREAAVNSHRKGSQVEKVFDALNDLHTAFTMEAGVSNEEFITALEQLRDVINDEIEDNKDN
jgi:hypothetical protein